MTVCPTGASYKRAEDGIVLVNESACIGCGLCAWACPYGARELDQAAGVMKKCTLCVDRIYNDNLPEEDRVPAYPVQNALTGALRRAAETARLAVGDGGGTWADAPNGTNVKLYTDADPLTAGDQAFAFIGSAAFNMVAGEVRVTDSGAGYGILSVDIDGNGISDLDIRVVGADGLAYVPVLEDLIL